MKYYQTFTVKGRGTFPFDMLRYDCCHPRDSADVDEMLSYRDVDRYVTLKRYVQGPKNQPTLARWLSFGWKVVETSIITNKL